MHGRDDCLKSGRSPTKPKGIRAEEDIALEGAVRQLEEVLANVSASIDNCFVFTLENRNQLMHHIAEVKEKADQAGCGYLLELCSLTEIITLILFRSHLYRDRQGLGQIELAVQQMQVCCSTETDSQSQYNHQRNHLPETVECLWRWVDANALPGIYATESPSHLLR